MAAKRFKRIYVEISNLCNLSCPFCPPVRRAPRAMTAAEFEHVARETRPFSDFIYLHVKGEPLYHPDIAEILALCRREGFRVNLTTNGTLVLPKSELLLSELAPRQINLSLQSGGGELEGLIDFARRLYRARGTFTVFRLWTLGKGRTPDARARLCMERLEAAFPRAAERGGLAAIMEKEKSFALEQGIFISWDEEFVWPSLSSPDLGGTGSCYGLRAMAAVLSDGTVTPCCLDAEGGAALGNIFETPFSELINGRRAAAVAEGFRNRRVLEPLCRKCSYRLRFGG